MIVVDNIHKYFGGFHAVDGTSLVINRNSITGIIGPNGSGKTTLLKIIAGILPPSSGKVEISGSIGSMININFGFNPELTGIENIEFRTVTLVGNI